MEEEHAGVAAPRPARALPGRPLSFRSDTYKMLFPQLPCFESDPSFMGGVHHPLLALPHDRHPFDCLSPIPIPFVFTFFRTLRQKTARGPEILFED